MEKPNLFNFAYNELSQDAFICWLLTWARPSNKDIDENLYNCAIKLINTFFKKHNKDIPSQYHTIDIFQQFKKIDVLVVINNCYAIIIEDKTHTKSHSDQLKRYRNEIKNMEFSDDKILAIYFKTGDQSDYSDVFNKGYKRFSRHDFLDILTYGNNLGIDDSVFQDYYEFLKKMDRNINSYKTLPVKEWIWSSWTGFYVKLQELLRDGNWSYVPNASGGFMGFWWYGRGNDDCSQYLQLEQEKFCFKIWVKNPDDQRNLRQKWYETIIAAGSKYSLDIVKPSRFGKGEHMTVAILKNDYRQKDKEGMLDLTKTIDLFRKAESLLDSVSEEMDV